VAKRAIAPTRSNFLRVQESLEHAQRGYDLLERKRQILVMELMDKMEAARNAQQQVREAMEHAFEALKSAAMASGTERLLREAAGIRDSHRLRISTRSVMGVPVPSISFNGGERGFPFGLLAGAGGADQVRERFCDALEPIVELAEIENAVLRLAREIKRTQRRVHALENTFIPDYEETIKFISDSLEEREREELVIMKKVKRMRSLEAEQAAGASTVEAQRG